MAKSRAPVSALPVPKWIKPQLTKLVDEAPIGDGWLHEVKYDGYRMHARIEGGKIELLTRTGLDWSKRYRATIEALRSLRVKSADLDGELCAVRPDRVPVFSRLQAAMNEGRTDAPVLFVFDLSISMAKAPPPCRWSSARNGFGPCSRARFAGFS